MATYKPKAARAHIVYKNAAGKRVKGVTTVTGQVAKHLERWIVKLVKDGYDYDAYMGELAAVGSCAHEMVFASLEGRPAEVDEYSPDQKKWAQIAADKTLGWATDPAVDLQVFSSEVPMVSEEMQVGGTMDLYCSMNHEGKELKTVADLKTSDSGIYLENFIQATGYALIAMENGLEVDAVAIVRAPKDTNQSMELKVMLVDSLEFQECADLFRMLNAQYILWGATKKHLGVR